ncbi:DNA endonuclease SmrA [Methylococcus sp. EFPC2]|uniref:DNA endonuclease SmrA n=1 Tax=Methylococcus sp. EFPC2 TaxID=2812648 RepID=UPI0019684015|nr:DNA endonuclease SmrA [Methylococcus sp. EFPC2]QSA95544.1 DNA endonuclease SmrA [Methylococcus sp. EFPC2]
MNDEEKTLFLQEMANVRPLKKTAAESPRRERGQATPGQAYRREAAQRGVREENFLPAEYIEQVAPEAVIGFRRPGIQHGVYRSLEQGKYPVEATLDLHLMTIEEARGQVYRFIHDCMRHQIRMALINHGKGARRGPRQAVIKSCVARWLPMMPEVMAFHSAQRFHGGTGAVYVLLRKSEEAKERTRESLGLKSEKRDF